MSRETAALRTGGIRAGLELALIAAGLSACVSINPGAAPDVPVALQVPVGQRVAMRLQGEGEQLYSCRADARDPSAFAWAFVAPQAALRDVTGKVVGRHYGGPTWESTDGSKVQGTVVAQEAAPDPQAIAWLLLRATTNSGSGMFARVTSIQRLHTKGGKPPAQPCGAAQLNQQIGTAYTAEYVFYVARS